jgi:hypothetical protein
VSALEDFYEAATDAIVNQDLGNYIDEEDAAELSRLFDSALVATTSSLEDTSDDGIDEALFRAAINRLQMIAFLAGLAAGQSVTSESAFDLGEGVMAEVVKTLLRDGQATISLMIGKPEAGGE